MDPLPGQVTCPACGGNYIPAWSEPKLSAPGYDRTTNVTVGVARTTVCAVCAEAQVDLIYRYQHPRESEVVEQSWTAYPHEDHAVDVVVDIMVEVQMRAYWAQEGEEMPPEEVDKKRSAIRSVFDKLREVVRETDPATILQLTKAANGVKDLLT